MCIRRILCGGLVCLTSLAIHGQGVAEQESYVRAATWADTMVANRAAFRARQDETAFTLEPWLVTPPMPADGFGQVHVDPGAPHAGTEKNWTPRPEYADSAAHNLPGKDGASTYLYRTIHASAPTEVRVRLGSDDGIQVWLNGQQCWVNDVPRVVAHGRDDVTLNLKAGENRLLLKIYNRSGGHGFYFEVLGNSARPLWDAIVRDFPMKSAWFQDDTPGSDPLVWFGPSGHTEVIRKTVGTALAQVSAESVLHDQFDALTAEDTSNDGARWLGLYVQACKSRELERELGTNRMAAVRRAVEDQSDSFPDRYDGVEKLKALQQHEEAIAALREAANGGSPPEVETVQALDRELSALLLSNPLLDFDRLLLVKRNASRLGLPQNWQGNCSVGGFGYDNSIEILSLAGPDGDLETFYRPDRNAFVGDLDLHFDGDRLLASMPGSHDRWQIWEFPLDGGTPRQVTPGDQPDVDNYDACYLPDGRIIFASTRCFQGVPCVAGSDQVANLFQMQADGSNIRQLCFDQDHNWCPTVMNNGRVMFTRWEYSDTPHYFSRLLFHMNPDGTNQVAYYGSNSYWPNSLFYARPIPNRPTQFIGIVSGHHGVPRMGELILFDVSKGRFEADGVVQRIPGHGKKVEPTIADQLVQNSWPRFLHPYPLNDRYFLVSCQPSPSDPWGIYLADVFDNLTLLKEVPGYALFEPVPLRPTAKPPIIPDKVRLDQDTATVYIADIYEGEGLRGVPRDTVKQLRVMEFHYAYNRTGGHEAIGYEGPWDVHRILGTAPVFEDGSALFEVPANLPIAVQPLDAEGKAVQLMRSWFTAMPGETVSCTGCHEQQNSAPPLRATMAANRAPAPLTPWYGPARGFSFPREVQPVLNRHCVRCHDDAPRDDGRVLPDFSARSERGWSGFTPAYLALHPYVRRPGPESDYHLLKPMEYHADTSPLIQMLEKGHGGVHLDGESWDRLITWIDLNVPDHGTWHEQCTIPDDLNARRLAMRSAHAGRPENPEKIPEIGTGWVNARASARVVQATADAPDVAGWPAQPAAAQEHQKKSVDLGDGVSLDLVLIPSGTFPMGSVAGAADSAPVSPVTISAPFWMSATEVTLAQFRQFRPNHRQGFIDQQNKDHTRPGYAIDDPELPVVRVTWEEAADFCRELSEATGLTFQLPTEAQWEWACRAGSAGEMSFDVDHNGDFSRDANLADASLNAMAVQGIDPQPIPNPSPFQAFLPKREDVDDGHMLLAPVASYLPNPWGLYDMHGNAAEWTHSAYRPYPYDGEDGRNAVSPDEARVVRGGSWRDLPKWSTASYRLAYAPWQPVYNVGFRVVCTGDAMTRIAQNQP